MYTTSDTFKNEYGTNNIIVICMSLLISSFMFTGLSGDNHNTILPALRILDPNFLVNDWFVNIKSSSLSIRSYFIYLTLPFIQFIGDVKLSYGVLFLLSNTIIGLFIYKISRICFKDEFSSQFIAYFSLVAGSTFWIFAMTNYLRWDFAPHTLGVLFILVSMYYYLINNYTLSIIFIGIATLFQILVGLHFFGLIVGSYILSSYSSKKLNLKNLSRFILYIPFLIIGFLPVIIDRFFRGSVPMSDEFILIRGSHLYLPSQWPMFHYFILLSFILLTTFAIIESKIEKKYKDIFINFLVVIGFYFIFSFIFVELIPIKFIEELQLFRSVTFIYLIGLIFIGELLWNKIQNYNNVSELLIFLYLAYLLLNQYRAPVGISITLLLLILYKIKTNQVSFKNFNYTFLLVMNIAVLLFYPIFRNYHTMHFIMLAFPLIVFGIIYYFDLDVETNISNLAKNLGYFSWIIALAFISILFYLFSSYSVFEKAFNSISTLIFGDDKRSQLLIFGLFLSWVIPIAQSKYKLNKSSAIIIFMLIVTTIIGYPLNQRKQLPKEYSEVIKFVEEHTDSNSIILVNPKLTEFKFYSKRAVIVDTKNSSPDKDPEGWLERMHDVTNNISLYPPDTRKNSQIGYQSLNKKEIELLKIKYNISYALFEKPKNLNYNLLYENNLYKVFDLR